MQATRTTKYTTAIIEILKSKNHATNAELLELLQNDYPDLSATTVHRATTRLAENGKIAIAPPDVNGSMRYDFNTVAHDHFICNGCCGIRDIDVAEKIIPTISKALGGCKITGRLTMSGFCETCHIKLG